MNEMRHPAISTAYRPRHRVRFVTATALFDGHDASINIMRRILQASGAEVIHLGHNRPVSDIVNAAVVNTNRQVETTNIGQIGAHYDKEIW